MNDTGGGNNLDLGDKILPSPDLPKRREIIIIIMNFTTEFEARSPRLQFQRDTLMTLYSVHCLYKCL